MNDDLKSDEAAGALAFWLAGIFAAPPDAARLAAWRAPQGQATLEALGAAAGVGAEVAAVLACRGDALAVARAHERLFSGMAGPRGVAPFQSVIAGGRLWGEAAAAMRARLAAAGVAPVAALEREPPDHVATELALLAALLQRGEGGAARALAREQMAPWLGRFAAALAEADPEGFHAAAAALAAALVERLSGDAAAS